MATGITLLIGAPQCVQAKSSGISKPIAVNKSSMGTILSKWDFALSLAELEQAVEGEIFTFYSIFRQLLV